MILTETMKAFFLDILLGLVQIKPPCLARKHSRKCLARFNCSQMSKVQHRIPVNRRRSKAKPHSLSHASNTTTHSVTHYENMAGGKDTNYDKFMLDLFILKKKYDIFLINFVWFCIFLVLLCFRLSAHLAHVLSCELVEVKAMTMAFQRCHYFQLKSRIYVMISKTIELSFVYFTISHCTSQCC